MLVARPEEERLENWDDDLDTYMGRAWSNRHERVGDPWEIRGRTTSAFDEDVFSALEDHQANRTSALNQLEEASFKLRYGRKLSQESTDLGFEWDNYVWEREEAILMSLVAGGFFGRTCFVEGTMVLLPDGNMVPIENLQLGTRVASMPADPGQIIPEKSIDPESWRTIRLRLTDPERGNIFISLLRSGDWLRMNSVAPGAPLWLSLPEMGIEGLADVFAVEPCPISAAGPSAGAVTGTFATQRAATVNLYLNGLDEPIGTTASHPFYSLDRNGWTPAGEFRRDGWHGSRSRDHAWRPIFFPSPIPPCLRSWRPTLGPTKTYKNLSFLLTSTSRFGICSICDDGRMRG